ncbi:MAG: hypothetical protein HQK77_16365 [Desulfobacterales bacterium]|nr:hypothetical protein [Desulfobacterales bacterium]
MLKARQNIVNAGINLSSMVLLGLAGKGKRAENHAIATAKITNEMKPHYLAALTVKPVPHTPLYQLYKNGEFELPDPFETLVEMKMIFETITIDNLNFVGTHASNYLPIKGTLQQDKAKMIELVSHVIENQDMSYLRSEHNRGL